MTDEQRMATACAYADAYVEQLRRSGLPTYPGWDSLPCQRKVLAFSTVLGGNTVMGVAQGIAIVLYYVNQDASLAWLKRATRLPSIRLPFYL